MNDEETDGYRWLNEYERSWEAIREDEHGSIREVVNEIENKDKKSKRTRFRSRLDVNRMSVMRHLVIILDVSAAMNEADLHPTRLKCVLKLLTIFVNNFFDQNPISQIAITITHDSKCQTVCELTGEEMKIKNSLAAIGIGGKGVPSLQNSLESSLDMLEQIPSNSSKEILLIYGSTATCDPGDIDSTITKLASSNICVSVISLTSEIFVLKQLAKVTGGRHFVAGDEHNFRDCLSQQILFPKEISNEQKNPQLVANLIRMGFPSHEHSDMISLCVCHSQNYKFDYGYFCPQCLSKTCNLPCECKTCGLLLVIAPHLARSYQRFFPLEPYMEHPNKEGYECYGCGFIILDMEKYKCDKCNMNFCNDCDISTHDTLGFCPGCNN